MSQRRLLRVNALENISEQLVQVFLKENRHIIDFLVHFLVSLRVLESVTNVKKNRKDLLSDLHWQLLELQKLFGLRLEVGPLGKVFLFS